MSAVGSVHLESHITLSMIRFMLKMGGAILELHELIRYK